MIGSISICRSFQGAWYFDQQPVCETVMKTVRLLNFDGLLEEVSVT